jgi:membrane protein EpsK
MDTSIGIDDNENMEQTPHSIGLTSARKHFIVNILSNAAYIGTQAVFTFWMTPYLIGFMGMAAYGMVPFTQNIVSYTAVLTTALNNAVTRFLTIQLEKGQYEEANKTFNTALFSVLALFILLTPATLVMALAFPNIFNIPAGWETETSWLFILMALNFIISVTGGYFSVSTFVHSEFLKFNLANFAGLFSRICCLVVLFSLFSPHLWYAGISTLLGTLISLLGYVLLWRKLTPELKINIFNFDRTKLKEQLGMGGWVVVNMVGSMLLSRVDLIIVNAYFGAIMTGGYASLTQFTLLMEYLVATAANVIRPIILIKYAQQDFLGLKKLCNQSVKLLGYGMALPVGLLCGFSKPFITLWLGLDYQYLSILMIAILIHQALNYSVRPMLYIHNAYNRVRWPGIVTLICGLGSMIFGIMMAIWNPLGVVGVALAVGLTWTIKNAIYMPVYTAHIMKLKWWSYLPSLLPSMLGTILVWCLAYLFCYINMPDNWFALAGASAVVSILYAIFVWAVGLKHEDRSLLIGFLPFLKRAENLSLSSH